MRKRCFSRILVTGGCGFIGSNFIRYLLGRDDFRGEIINVDLLTYAGNPMNMTDIERQYGNRYKFSHIDINDTPGITELMKKHEVDAIVHFAAESHVDRSISGPGSFIKTNITGTYSLLEAARACWEKGNGHFHHVSTDEVYGSLGESGYFSENTPYDPRSPYSASKAASDHLVSAYHHTYGIPVTITNCSNNYGPYQFPEKLVPLMISNIISGKNLPVYGDGKNVRDWLFVDDHNSAVWLVMQTGKPGETYNVGGENEIENIRLVNLLCEKIARIQGRQDDHYRALITYVKDRPGHDRRYAINCGKIKTELGWKRIYDFERGIETTITWYLNNNEWMENIKSGEYLRWIETHYGSGV